jgi:catechol 2,3-dioxygenase-like lactoylglutathione lyase family enzyme
MIDRMSHCTLFVRDQDSALAFYRDKLGFEVRNDVKGEGFRWTTVAPAGQTHPEIVLMEPKAGFMFDQDTVDRIKGLLEQGALGAGVFQTSDCQGTYEELKARGVEFMREPKEQPWGLEALFRDDSGNWFSLTEPR